LDAYKRQEAIAPGTSPYSTIDEIKNDTSAPYTKHPLGPVSHSNHAEVQKALRIKDPKARKAVLYRLANKYYKQAFRIENKTYGGPK